MDSQKVISKMKKLLIETHQNWYFSQLTTLGCGGKIELVILPNSQQKLIKAVRYLQFCQIPFCILGRGSNVLASDDHFDGVVICTKNLDKLTCVGNKVIADCGVSTVKFAKLCASVGLGGSEFFGCLPASVGGAVVCNAGCFGQVTQQIVESVKVLRKGKIKVLSNKNCNFSHRNSLFKNNDDYVVLQATFSLQKRDSNVVAHNIAQMKSQKAKSQPLSCKTAGCVLYNPNVAISLLVDKCGLKGYSMGDAKVSKKHAGFVVNIDKATAKDIYLLVEYLQRTVYEKYNVASTVELCLVNFPKDKNDFFSNNQK